MPNPWKKPPQPPSGLSRLVSGLRHEGGSSSLVVQTGFPTSLADLVVKNRDRLKKPSRRKKRSSDLDSSAGDVAAASLVSDFVHSPPPPREDRRCRPRAPVVVERITLQGSDCAPLSALAAAGPTKRRGFGFWLGILSVKLFVLAIPAMYRRKLVAGITVAAFGLLILDIIGVRVFKFLRRCTNATMSPELAFGDMDLERTLVSPIREIGDERLVSPVGEVGNEGRSFSCSVAASQLSKSSSDLVDASEERKSSSNLIGAPPEWSKSCPDLLMETVGMNQETKVSTKRRDLGAFAKVCVSQFAGSSSNSKAKRLLGKFLPKKLRRKRRNGNDVNAIALDLNSSEVSNSITEEEEEAMNGHETAATGTESTDDVVSSIASDGVSNCNVEENVAMALTRARGAKCISAQHLAWLAIILLGLLGGKTVALVLTVILLLFCKSTESLRKKTMDSVV